MLIDVGGVTGVEGHLATKAKGFGINEQHIGSLLFKVVAAPAF